MKKPMLQTIEDLIDFLPEKDIPIAKRLLKERKLEDLVDLISSALFKVEKAPATTDFAGGIKITMAVTTGSPWVQVWFDKS